jgi:predicted DsbA family dithiol-disulfide isomerase
MGKRRLEKAIKQIQQQQPGAQFKVHWLPYQLNPAAGDQPVNKMQVYNDKFGPARVAQIVPAMTVSVTPLFLSLVCHLQCVRRAACSATAQSSSFWALTVNMRAY